MLKYKGDKKGLIEYTTQNRDYFSCIPNLTIVKINYTYDYLRRYVMGKFVIKKTNTGVKFDLKASNGQVIAQSEGYTTYANCVNGVDSVKKNAVDAEIVEE